MAIFGRWTGPALRTTEEPWLRDDLSLREVEQVVTGTVLMLQVIYKWPAFANLLARRWFLEHPKGRGAQEGRWSIWDSAFVRLLLLAGSIQRIDFLQGPLGQPFPKPASLLAGRLPDLPHQFFALNQLHWRATKRLGG